MVPITISLSSNRRTDPADKNARTFVEMSSRRVRVASEEIQGSFECLAFEALQHNFNVVLAPLPLQLDARGRTQTHVNHFFSFTMYPSLPPHLLQTVRVTAQGVTSNASAM